VDGADRISARSRRFSFILAYVLRRVRRSRTQLASFTEEERCDTGTKKASRDRGPPCRMRYGAAFSRMRGPRRAKIIATYFNSGGESDQTCSFGLCAIAPRASPQVAPQPHPRWSPLVPNGRSPFDRAMQARLIALGRCRVRCLDGGRTEPLTMKPSDLPDILDGRIIRASSAAA